MDKFAWRGRLRPEKAEIGALEGRIGAWNRENDPKCARSRPEGVIRGLYATFSDLP